MMKKLKLRPRARIIRTVGDRLISGPIAAIIELIKNAHDADASYVKLSFHPSLVKGKGKIVVEDDGHGMSFNDIRDKWMEPATSDKKNRKKSPAGRNMLGSKGIGRFSAARLGDLLTLETVCLDQDKDEAYKTVVKDIDWNVFEETEYLDEIEFDYHIQETEESTGTRLIITSLRDDWTENYMKSLYNELRKMIAPNATGGNSERSFEIFLDLSECNELTTGWKGSEIVNSNENQYVSEEEYDWKVKPIPLLDACDYQVIGSFDNEGYFEGTIEIKRGGLKPEEIKLSPPKMRERYESGCGEIAVSFYIFDRDKDAVLDMAKRAGRGNFTYKQAREMLDDFVGVKIYRDDYRIRPYGDTENDWLELDKQRVQSPKRIGHDHVSGYIIVDDEEKSGLTERSSREGFEEGPEFRRLKSLINNLFLQKISPERYKFRQKIKAEKDNADASFSGAKTLAKLAWIEQIIEHLPDKEKESARKTVTKKSEKLVRYLESIEEKHAILEAKVTLGMIVAEVIHEGRTPIQFIKTETARLARWWPTLFDDSEQSRKNREESPRIIRGLSGNAEKLKTLLDSLQPISGIKRNKPIKFDPVALILDTLSVFQGKIDKLGVETPISNPDGIDEILGFKQDLQPAISNIVDNALYWLEYAEISKPEISFDLKKAGQNCVIIISNNGSPVPDQYLDTIFDIGFGLKENGSGLGLPIAKEALARGNGQIEYTAPDKGGAAFKITFPFKV